MAGTGGRGCVALPLLSRNLAMCPPTLSGGAAQGWQAHTSDSVDDTPQGGTSLEKTLAIIFQRQRMQVGPGVIWILSTALHLPCVSDSCLSEPLVHCACWCGWGRRRRGAPHRGNLHRGKANGWFVHKCGGGLGSAGSIRRNTSVQRPSRVCPTEAPLHSLNGEA